MAKRNLKKIEKRGDAIKVVIKSNELVEARYMFDTWETRFFYTLVTLISKHDEDDKVHRVYFKDIKKNFKINSNKSYDLLREAAQSLARKSVYIGWMNDKFRRGRDHSLFEFVDYLEKGQSGEGIERQEYVDVKIHKSMLPFLLHVKKNFDPAITRYTSYELRNIEKLKPYAVRMYELFKQHEYKGERTINVQDLKDMFLISEEYSRFSTFNQSVIKPSIESINKYTDLDIPDPINIKRGRKINAIKFIIRKKTDSALAEVWGASEQLELDFEETSTKALDYSKVEVLEVKENADQEINVQETGIEVSEKESLYNEFEDIVVKDFGLSRFVLLQLIDKYKADRIRKQIRVVKRMLSKGNVNNVAGLFMEAVKNDYLDTDETKELKKQEKKAKSEKLKVLKREMEVIEDEKTSDTNERIRVLVAENPNLTFEIVEFLKKQSVTEMLLKIRDITIEAAAVEHFREDPVLRAMVKNTFIERYPERFEDILEKYESAKKRVDGKIQLVKRII